MNTEINLNANVQRSREMERQKDHNKKWETFQRVSVNSSPRLHHIQLTATVYPLLVTQQIDVSRYCIYMGRPCTKVHTHV